MITGAHSIVYSKNPAADRAFLRDVLGFPHVDVGEGWLIFGLPPSEVAVHPSGKNDVHEFYLMVDDVEHFVRTMKAKHVGCAPPRDLGWGVLTQVKLPGGGRLGVYEPRHARPPAARATKGTRTAKVVRRARPASATKATKRASPAGRKAR